MPIVNLKDLSDPRLKLFSNFTDAQLMRGEYRHVWDTAPYGVFIAESQRVIERALDAGIAPVALFVEQRWLAHEQQVVDRVLRQHAQVPVFVATTPQFQQLTGYKVTRGAAAAFQRPQPATPDQVLADACLVAVLEDVTNYTNMGSMFRSAAALGFDAVLVTPQCHDPLYRRCARVSMGAVLQVPWARIEGPSDWAQRGIGLLHDQGFFVASMALCDGAVGFDSPLLDHRRKMALVLGTEGDGLRQSTIEASDVALRIPMAHEVDSLNVGAAAAIAFWELAKRRGATGAPLGPKGGKEQP